MMISLLGKTRDQVAMIKKGPFYCPICRQMVQVKAGTINIPHFSHLSLEQCPSEWERESWDHLTGKLQLQDIFLKLNWNVDLEFYLNEISQKPDLLIEKDMHRMAIEYQCSSLSLERLHQRIEGYRKFGIEQRWIFGPQQLTLLKASQARLSEVAFSCLQRANHQFYGWALDVNRQTLIHIHHFLPFSPRKVFCLHTPYSLQNVNPVNPKNSLPKILQDWEKERLKWSVFPNISKDKRDQAYNRFLYLENTHRSLLPPFIGIPQFSLPFIKTPAVVWQGYVFFDLFRLIQKQTKVSIQQLLQLIKKRVNTGEIMTRTFMFIPSSFEIPIQDYVKFLIQIHVFHKKENHIIMGHEGNNIRFNSITQDQSIQELIGFYQKYKDTILKERF